MREGMAFKNPQHSVGVGLDLPMFCARHPLVAHRVGSGAVKRAGCFFGLCLGGVQLRHGSLSGVLRRGDAGHGDQRQGRKNQVLHGDQGGRRTLSPLGWAPALRGWRFTALAMARFLLVLQPRVKTSSSALLDALQPLLEAMHAEVDHRTSAHISALLRGGSEQLRMQLFVDVQAKAEGQVVELALMSREPMGKGAPQSRAVFEAMLNTAAERLPDLELRHRSDRDGALPG